MIISILKRRYFNHYISKFVGFIQIYYTINLYIIIFLSFINLYFEFIDLYDKFELIKLFSL